MTEALKNQESQNLGDDRPPQRACVLRLNLQADTREAVIDALNNIGIRIACEQMTTGVSGGYDSGYDYEYTESAEPSHDEYVKKLNAWLERKRQKGSA
jgi:hypothetical protein